MASNALLGSRISLISKKNIRYEGILYSINETDATVALQNVKSYGTEGRELLDTTGTSTFVPPNDVIHAYLLFRGQDIKDLHVHEKTGEEQQAGAAAATAQGPAPTATPTAPAAAPENELDPPMQAPSATVAAEPTPVEKENKAEKKPENQPSRPQPKKQQAGEKTKPPPSKNIENEVSQPKRQQSGESKENKPATQQKKTLGGGAHRKKQNMVGTGASLLNRKTRGAKGDQAVLKVEGDFDFESNLAEFDKANISTDMEDEDAPNINEDGHDAYSKDDFFDSISSDATDRANGIDNRLRGAAERNLNLNTFGAVSLNHGSRSRGRRYGGGGRGRGGRGGRGRGRSRGRGGRGGAYRGGSGGGYSNHRHEQGNGPVPRQNNRWKESAY